MNGDVESTGTILVVDDDPVLRVMAERTLRHAGFEVVAVGSGEEALAAFGATRFSLVLLDVLMPGIDGYDVCRRLRASPQGATLPILMLTGLNDTGSIERAFEAGATDFAPKPLHWTLLAQRVRYALRAAAALDSAARNRDRLERAQHIASMGSWEFSADGATMTCSEALAEIFGAPRSARECLSPANFLERVHPDDRPGVSAAREQLLRDGTPYRLNYRIVRFDGTGRTVFEQAIPAVDTGGSRTGVEGITQDVTDRVEAERRIAHLARCDALTGLANRSTFITGAAATLAQATRLDRGCALFHIDVDSFKSVNDAWGRAVGDRVLVEIGSRLEAAVRGDALAQWSRLAEAHVARVGANAFAVLLAGVDDDREAGQLAGRLVGTLTTPIVASGRALELSASVGIAMYPRDAREPKSLARCAEQAAYEAKASGRGERRFFDEAIHAEASKRLERELELRRAIAGGELELHYQPKIDVSTGEIVGAEALTRWRHPTSGLGRSADFIGVAEESGLIGPLTDWVLETACADLRHRLDAGLRAVAVSVNLASPTFARDDLLARLDALVTRHRLDASAITLEVTESLLMKDVDRAVERLQALRDRGFRLSLDDFGTGFSSLSYLRRFPIDEIKIDRSFVDGVGRGGREAAIARAVIALGREFGLQVVAEGVETDEQAEFLARHRCTIQQGYRYARPMPSREFDALLAAGGRLPASVASRARPADRAVAVPLPRSDRAASAPADAPHPR